jgi:hypothetical protein
VRYVTSLVFRSINVVKGDVTDKRVRADAVRLHKPLTDEQGGGSAIHHSHYRRATIPTLEAHLNLEMRTRWH